MKRITLTIIATLATFMVVWVLWQLRSVVLLFVFSLGLAATLRTPIEFMNRWNVPRVLSVTIVYLVVFGGLLGLASMLTMRMAGEFADILENAVAAYQAAPERLESGPPLAAAVAANLPSTSQLIEMLAAGQTSGLARDLLGITQNLIDFLTHALLAIVLSIYWTADRLRFERLWLSLLPPEQRSHTRRVWRTLEANVGAYVRSEVVQSIAGGALLTAGFWLMGAPYPFTLAFVAALAWLVPLVGAAIAAVAVLLLGSLGGATVGILATLYTLTVLAFLEFGVEPRLHRHDRYGAILVLLSTIAMVDALGLIGLLLAPPLAVAIQVVLNEVLDVGGTAPAPEFELNKLREGLTEVRSLIDNTPTPSPRIQNLAERLENLMKDVERVAT